MSDGRAFTDYKPRCSVFESLIKSHPQPMNSYELRQYMIQNGEAIMKSNRQVFEDNNTCSPCKKPWNIGTMLPEQSMVKCNASTCSVSINDPYGLGQGRDYNTAVQIDYIKRMEQKNDKMEGYINDVDYHPVSSEEQRYAVPGGGIPY
jgi:hypothetical protein